MELSRIGWMCLLVFAMAATAFGGEAEDGVEKAMTACLADGTHYARCAPLVALGPSAVEPLTRILADSTQGLQRRTLAAQALGRLKAAKALPQLRRIAAAKGTPDPLRKGAEHSLFLLGDTRAADARIERLLTKYAVLEVARESAWYQVAQTYSATGRFGSAARVMRTLVQSLDLTGREHILPYDWACYECLAGNREAAMKAVAMAIESERTDLDWMARDGDLLLISKDAAFLALLEAARAKRGASAVKKDAPPPTPDEVAYKKFSRSYWDGAFEKHIGASNRYWEGYTEWLETTGRTPSPEAAELWKKERKKGPEPEDPSETWIPRFKEQLAKHAGTPLAAKIRGELLTIYSNHRKAKEWTELFVEMAAKTPEHEVVGGNAETALFMAEEAKRSEEVLALLEKCLKEHPEAPSGAGIRIALAGNKRGSDEAAARRLYKEVSRLYPKSFEAEEATGALYEMENLTPGAPAPVFDATDIRGKHVSLASLEGKVVLLDFWATWCGPCLGEIPHLKKLHAAFSDRADFVLLGISLDGDGIALVDMLEEKQILWPQICSRKEFGDELGKLYNVRGIPDSCLIDRDGKIIERGLRGEKLHEAVREALGDG